MVNHPTSEMTLPPAKPAAMTRSCFQFQDLTIRRKSLKDNQLPPPPPPPPHFQLLTTVSHSLFTFHRGPDDRCADVRCSIRAGLVVVCTALFLRRRLNQGRQIPISKRF